MPRIEDQKVAFNRGLESPLAIARVDLKRTGLSAAVMDNWQARELGSMMLRPGTGYLSSTASNAAARNVSFVYRANDTALIEFTNAAMRVRVSDELVTRVDVVTAVTNGNFTSDVSGWTDSDEAGGVSQWVTDGAGGGYMELLGNGVAAAIRDQQVTVSGADANKEHALRIVVARGPVTVLIGSSSGGGQYISDTTLVTGTHSLAFTPTGDFWIRFMSTLDRKIWVDSCNVEAAGVMSITSPYLAADLDNIRGNDQISQSGNVIFVACVGYQQRKIIRYSTNGWGLGLYAPEDGPFRVQNVSATTLTPSALSGNITITASRGVFRSTHEGALFQIVSNGQTVTASITAQNTFTGAIRVTGVGAAGRQFSITVTGLTASGSTVTLQKSVDSDTGPWVDVTSYTTDQSTTLNDGLDNQIIWYRIGVKTGGFGAGTQVPTLTYSAGSITGVARVTDFTSATSVGAEVLQHMGGTSATDSWSEGQWSDFRGWPTAVGFYESRLVWAGKDGGVQLSTTDGFDVWTTTDSAGDAVGDSGPINRSIGSGPVDVINWMLPLQRLILGGEMAEFSMRSSSFDEPLTPTNSNIKPCSSQGGAPVNGVKIDAMGAYVQRGGTRLYNLNFDAGVYEYTSEDLTLFYPEAGGEPDSGTYIKRMAVQRQPDTRIHCIRSDGVAAVLVFNKAENVLCWQTHSTDGTYEDVAVLPSIAGQREDQVYYVVKRTINGSTVRYLEKWAYESECQGGALNKQADSFVYGNQVANTVITGLTHLIGETVICWHDGICEMDSNNDPMTYVVNGSGEITLGTAATSYVVGLPYNADYESTKLGTALTHYKNIDHLGLVLRNTHPLSLLFGPELDDSRMDPISAVQAGFAVDPDTIFSTFDEPPMIFPGKWSTDERLCMRARAPLPCNILAGIVQGEVH